MSGKGYLITTVCQTTEEWMVIAESEEEACFLAQDGAGELTSIDEHEREIVEVCRVVRPQNLKCADSRDTVEVSDG